MFSPVFQGFSEFGREQKSLVDLRVFLGKTEKSRKRKDREAISNLFRKIETVDDYSNQIDILLKPESTKYNLREARCQ